MLPENPKLASLGAMVEIRQNLRVAEKNLVLTNGCFDLLHTGHIYFLQHARLLGDQLLVALNSDASVRLLKGPKRPLQTELQRAFALAALSCVDHILIFNGSNLMDELTVLQPDIYTKAGDYTLDRLHPGERAVLEKGRAKIKFLPFLEGFSTTSLIRRIIDAGGID